MVPLPVSSHDDIGLPTVLRWSAFPHVSIQQLSYGRYFGVADIPLCSGLLLCSPPWLLLPTTYVSSCDFYIQATLWQVTLTRFWIY